MLLVDGRQTGRTFEVAIDDHDALGVLLFGRLVEDLVDRVAKLDAGGAELFGRAGVEVGCS